LKAFSRQGMKLSKYRQRFPTDFDPKLERSNYLETKRADFEKDAADEVRRIVVENRADLTDVERTVIEHRFGLESGENEKPMTLEQVGQIIGVTKERVRQIQNKAMEKIKLELEAKFLGTRKVEDMAMAGMVEGQPGAGHADVGGQMVNVVTAPGVSSGMSGGMSGGISGGMSGGLSGGMSGSSAAGSSEQILALN
jgi:hypothetical protein